MIIKLTENQINSIIGLLTEAYLLQESFEVLRSCQAPKELPTTNLSRHVRNERSGRISAMGDMANMGTPVYSFIVKDDKTNNEQIHTITDKAVIMILNRKTRKIITMFPGEPGQIKRYWLRLNKPLPDEQKFKEILIYAIHNKQMRPYLEYLSKKT